MPLIVMVLNDGETYTSLHGCAIMQIPDHVDAEEIDEYVKFGPADRIVTQFVGSLARPEATGLPEWMEPAQ